jgi:ornithine cyclodeaminase
MSLLILNHSEVEQLLSMNECITVMEEAFNALAQNEFHQPLRTITKPPNVKGVMALMPTFRSGETPLFGLKAICVFQERGNRQGCASGRSALRRYEW